MPRPKTRGSISALGPARTIDEIEVRWPSGRVDHFRDLPADTGYLIREGEPCALPLPGFAKATGG